MSRLGLPEGVVAGNGPGPIPFNPGAQGEYTRARPAVSPLQRRAMVFGRTEEGMIDTPLSFESWQGDEEEYSVAPSQRIVLECRCGEGMILLGLEADWSVEKRCAFECECGERLTIASNRVDERAFFVKQLLRRGHEAPFGTQRR